MIEGRLVRLRARAPSDAERVERWLSDPEIARNMGERYGVSLSSTQRRVEAATSKFMTFSRVALSIDTKEGQHIGGCSLFNTSPEDHSAWLGIMIGERAYWSKGYGGDALLTLCRFGYEEMGLNRVALEVWGFNEHAMRCYRRCGFVGEARLREDLYRDGAYHDTVVMSMLRDEFFAGHGRTEG
jgi:RimJ/RimL family protein N-acetyltransferase